VPSPVQGLDPANALTQEQGLSGKLPLLFDEVLAGVWLCGDLRQGPYVRDVVPGQRFGSQAGAGAGEFSLISFHPSPGEIVMIDRVQIENRVAGVRSYSLRLYDAALFAAGAPTVVATRPFVDMRADHGPRVLPVSSFIRESHSTGIIVGGAILDSVTFAAEGTQTIELAHGGLSMHGSSPNGPPVLAVFGQAANEQVVATYYGRVYRAIRGRGT